MLIDHKLLILLITFLFAVGGAGYALLATPIYRGDALVQVERRATVNPLEDVAAGMLGEERESSTAAEVQILQSRLVLGQVVERNELDHRVESRKLPLIGNFVLRHGIERPGLMDGRPEIWGGEWLELGRLEVADHLRGIPLRVVAGEGGRYTLSLDGETPRALGEARVGELARFAEGDIELRVAALEAPEGAEFSLFKHRRVSAIRDLGDRLSVAEVGVDRGTSTGMLRLTLTGPDRDEIRRSLDAVAETFLTQNVRRQSAE
ncbi:Wzz/FepE/Etk N-terminal domain-containing protein, partial [Halomonas sp. EGI 63088]|nr:Wzz/FepE/Etk N-terminal domain-containing protein [Halomonas flagellata]